MNRARIAIIRVIWYLEIEHSDRSIHTFVINYLVGSLWRVVKGGTFNLIGLAKLKNNMFISKKSFHVANIFCRIFYFILQSCSVTPVNSVISPNQYRECLKFFFLVMSKWCDISVLHLLYFLVVNGESRCNQWCIKDVSNLTSNLGASLA